MSEKMRQQIPIIELAVNRTPALRFWLYAALWAVCMVLPACESQDPCGLPILREGEEATPGADGWIMRTITIGADQGGAVLVFDGNGLDLKLNSCPGDGQIAYFLRGGAGTTTHWVSLPPGHHAIASRGVSSVALQGYLPPSLLGEECATAITIPLDPDGMTSIDLREGSVLTGWVRLQGDGASYDVWLQSLGWDNMLEPGPVAICTDCSAGATCTPLPSSTVTTLTISDQATLHLQNVFAAPNNNDLGGSVSFHPGGTLTSP